MSDAKPLLGVRAFVDVSRQCGNDRSMIVNKLKRLGATVCDTIVPTITHVIFKDGSKITVSKAKKLGAYVVGVDWVKSCQDSFSKVPEYRFVIEAENSSKKKRQKMMLPKDFEDELKQASEKMSKVKKRRSGIQIPSPLTIVGDRINLNNYISAPRTPPAMQKRIDKLREQRGSFTNIASSPVRATDPGTSPLLKSGRSPRPADPGPSPLLKSGRSPRPADPGASPLLKSGRSPWPADPGASPLLKSGRSPRPADPGASPLLKSGRSPRPADPGASPLLKSGRSPRPADPGASPLLKSGRSPRPADPGASPLLKSGRSPRPADPGASPLLKSSSRKFSQDINQSICDTNVNRFATGSMQSDLSQTESHDLELGVRLSDNEDDGAGRNKSLDLFFSGKFTDKNLFDSGTDLMHDTDIQQTCSQNDLDANDDWSARSKQAPEISSSASRNVSVVKRDKRPLDSPPAKRNSISDLLTLHSKVVTEAGEAANRNKSGHSSIAVKQKPLSVAFNGKKLVLKKPNKPALRESLEGDTPVLNSREGTPMFLKRKKTNSNESSPSVKSTPKAAAKSSAHATVSSKTSPTKEFNYGKSKEFERNIRKRSEKRTKDSSVQHYVSDTTEGRSALVIGSTPSLCSNSSITTPSCNEASCVSLSKKRRRSTPIENAKREKLEVLGASSSGISSQESRVNETERDSTLSKQVEDNLESEDVFALGSSTKNIVNSKGAETCNTEILNTERISRRSSNIVLTSLHAGDRGMVKAIVKKLGGYHVSKTVDSNTTHVVCGDSRRTLNVLMGISYGCWIVSIDWVLASLNSDKWLDCEDYLMADVFNGATKQRRKQILANKNKLFSNFGSMYICSNTEPSQADLTSLVQLNGGKVAKTRRSCKIAVGKEYCRKTRYFVVRENWLLDCVSSQRLLDPRPYKYQVNNSSSDDDDDDANELIFS